jgi:hypothetical protein
MTRNLPRLALMAAIVIATMPSRAQDTLQRFPAEAAGPDALVIGNTPVHMSFTFACGKSGSVAIHMEDGTVTFSGTCTPKAGALAFWKAIRDAYGVGCPAGHP